MQAIADSPCNRAQSFTPIFIRCTLSALSAPCSNAHANANANAKAKAKAKASQAEFKISRSGLCGKTAAGPPREFPDATSLCATQRNQVGVPGMRTRCPTSTCSPPRPHLQPRQPPKTRKAMRLRPSESFLCLTSPIPFSDPSRPEAPIARHDTPRHRRPRHAMSKSLCFETGGWKLHLQARFCRKKLQQVIPFSPQNVPALLQFISRIREPRLPSRYSENGRHKDAP